MPSRLFHFKAFFFFIFFFEVNFALTKKSQSLEEAQESKIYCDGNHTVLEISPPLSESHWIWSSQSFLGFLIVKSSYFCLPFSKYDFFCNREAEHGSTFGTMSGVDRLDQSVSRKFRKLKKQLSVRNSLVLAPCPIFGILNRMVPRGKLIWKWMLKCTFSLSLSLRNVCACIWVQYKDGGTKKVMTELPTSYLRVGLNSTYLTFYINSSLLSWAHHYSRITERKMNQLFSRECLLCNSVTEVSSNRSFQLSLYKTLPFNSPSIF